MIKVVIDTNVFISSFFGGNPKNIIDLWKKGEIKLCLSREIVDEYARPSWVSSNFRLQFLIFLALL